MTRRMCRDCRIRPTTPESPEGTMCEPCYDYAGWENTHSDYGHEDTVNGVADRDDDCPVCHPNLDPRNVTPKSGHHNTAPTSGVRIDHTGHDHPRTPRARAACRNAMRADATQEGEIEARMS